MTEAFSYLVCVNVDGKKTFQVVVASNWDDMLSRVIWPKDQLKPAIDPCRLNEFYAVQMSQVTAVNPKTIADKIESLHTLQLEQLSNLELDLEEHELETIALKCKISELRQQIKLVEQAEKTKLKKSKAK